MNQEEKSAFREFFRAESIVEDTRVLLALIDAGEDFARSTRALGRSMKAYGRMYARWMRLSWSVYRSGASLFLHGEPRAAIRRCLALDLFDGLAEDVSIDDERSSPVL
jgi:hypothetical protein